MSTVSARVIREADKFNSRWQRHRIGRPFDFDPEGVAPVFDPFRVIGLCAVGSVDVVHGY